MSSESALGLAATAELLSRLRLFSAFDAPPSTPLFDNAIRGRWFRLSTLPTFRVFDPGEPVRPPESFEQFVQRNGREDAVPNVVRELHGERYDRGWIFLFEVLMQKPVTPVTHRDDVLRTLSLERPVVQVVQFGGVFFEASDALAWKKSSTQIKPPFRLQVGLIVHFSPNKKESSVHTLPTRDAPSSLHQSRSPASSCRCLLP